MPVKIDYVGSQLILPKIECDCGMPHDVPDIDIYIGSNIVKDCVEFIGKRNFGRNAVLVADNITYPLAGELVERLLTQAGYHISLCLLEREGVLEPDEAALGEILYAMERQTDFLIAVGSGSINDLTRYVAVMTGKPFVSVGTAASMDGYTSVVSPLLNKGLKVHKPGVYPKVLICDLEIMRNAPLPMSISGFGDVLGKYIAIADWRLGRIINDEPYCPVSVDIVSQALQKCVDNMDGIKGQTTEGIQSLIEALILSGLTILMIGNTRPVASMEHNMAHYWEMMQLVRKVTPPSHGTAVGVATGYMIKFFEEFLSRDFAKVDLEKVKQNRLPHEERKKLILEKYGPQFGSAIIKENPEDFLTWEEQERRIKRVIDREAEIRRELEFLPTWSQVKAIFERLGAPLSAADIGLSDSQLYDALAFGKDYRSRYTVAKTADELGILDEIVQKVLGAYKGC